VRIAVAGGTGTLGAAVARTLAERGHEVVVLSRRAPRTPAPRVMHRAVDLATEDGGLTAAVADCAVVVDAVNGAPNAKGARFLVEASGRLLGAGRDAGVAHHVCASIVGCDRVPTRYYRGKTAQEAGVERGPVPWTIVRATQFHALVAGTFAAAARYGVVPAPRFVLQPVDHREAARVVADVAEAGPQRSRVEVGGPEIVTVRELARRWKAATGSRAVVTALPFPGAVGRALRSGALTDPVAASAASATFDAWLARRR
jgi:uncharacterized protein YbjT (DUF2867 family)